MQIVWGGKVSRMDKAFLICWKTFAVCSLQFLRKFAHVHDYFCFHLNSCKSISLVNAYKFNHYTRLYNLINSNPLSFARRLCSKSCKHAMFKHMCSDSYMWNLIMHSIAVQLCMQLYIQYRIVNPVSPIYRPL